MAPCGFALLGTLTLQLCSIGYSPEGSAGWCPRVDKLGFVTWCHVHVGLLKALGIQSSCCGQIWISRTRAAHSHLNYFQNEVDMVH